MNGQARRVEDLSRYGRPLNDFPRGAQKKQEQIFMGEIKKRYGALGRIPFFLSVFLEQRRLKKSYREAVSQIESSTPGALKEFLMLVAMFNVIARRDGRENAYATLQRMAEKVAPYSMNAIYQVDELVQCEGDVFDNFKKFHMAMFEASQSLFSNTQTHENDRLTSIVDRCANVDYFNALDCPELARWGCDHDLAGYPAITDRIGIEFRRPCTIAKGSKTCNFLFYRKGTAPDSEEIDGKMVAWEESLSR